MGFEIKKAQRSLAKLKLGIAGTSGSGKTLGALLIGYGLIKSAHPNYSEEEIWDKICIIDTENESGSLYVGKKVGKTQIGVYTTISFSPPFTPQRYMEAIELAEDSGMEFLIIDSLTHAWAGEGGMLDIQQRASVKSGNSYTAWREVTPLHNRLVDKILQSNMHIVVTMRTKAEYTLEENDRGKKTPKKIGMAPIFRDGIEYEFTIFFDVMQDHYASATKDRTGIFDQRTFIIDAETGAEIYQWLSGATPEQTKPTIKKAENPALERHNVDGAPSDTANQNNELSQGADEPDDTSMFDDVESNEKRIPTQEELNKYANSVLTKLNTQEKLSIAEKIKAVNGGKSNYKNVQDDSIRQKIMEIFESVA